MIAAWFVAIEYRLQMAIAPSASVRLALTSGATADIPGQLLWAQKFQLSASGVLRGKLRWEAGKSCDKR